MAAYQPEVLAAMEDYQEDMEQSVMAKAEKMEAGGYKEYLKGMGK